MPFIPEIPNSTVIVIASTQPGLDATTTTAATTMPPLRSLDHVANLATSSYSSSHNYNDNDIDDDGDDNDGNMSAQNKKNKTKNNNAMRKSLSRIRTLIRSSSRKLTATASSKSSLGGSDTNSNNNQHNNNRSNNYNSNNKHEYNDAESKRTTKSEASCNSDYFNEHYYNDSEAVSSHVVKTQQPLTLLSTNRSNMCDAQERLLAEKKEASRRISSRNYNDNLEPSPTFDYSVNENKYDNDNDDDTEDDTYIHVMVNRERMARGLSPLKPSTFLTMLARAHAHVLADRTKLGHSVETLEDLQHTLNSLDVGENIQRGPNVQEMHRMSIKEGTFNCMNILRESYLEFGVGLAKGRNDNKLYMVQLFRGRLNNNNNRSSSTSAVVLGRKAQDKLEPEHHQQQQKQQQLVDVATTSDTVMDRFLLCSLCW